MTPKLLARWLVACSTVVVSAGLGACATTSEKSAKEQTPPPQIYANMPLDKALTAGIDHGGETLVEVRKLVKRRGEGAQAAALLTAALEKGLASYESHQLINASHLLMATPTQVSPQLFRQMVTSPRPLANQLGWQLAAMKPGPVVAQAIEQELTRAITENDEELVLLPQMANAIAANRMKASYTWARQGLFRKGNEEFARAMITLDPRQASDDMLAYLAMAPAEELRQLTLATVNLYTCVEILQHLKRYPATLGRAGFDHLFLFAVSRNGALAEHAQGVIEAYIPAQTEAMAQILARHPVWVQIAYLENARRRMNPKLGLILAELKKVSAEHDVVREIDEIQL